MSVISRLGQRHRVPSHVGRAFARSMAAAMCAVGVGTSDAHGQALKIPGGADATQIITNAEADGARFRRIPNPAVVRVMFSSPPDSRTGRYLIGRDAGPNVHAEGRKCVAGQEMGPIRSGEFVIGGQLSGSVAMVAGQRGKVWWAPLHEAPNMPPLLVRGRSLTTPADTVRFSTGDIARSVGGTGRHYFFPSGITIPRPGRWLLIATSGANWGCFILTAR